MPIPEEIQEVKCHICNCGIKKAIAAMMYPHRTFRETIKLHLALAHGVFNG